MAINITAGSEEYVTQGPLGVRGIATVRRKYNLSDLVTFQERHYAKFDNILRQEMRIITVDDPEPKVLARNEAPIKIDIKSDDTDTDYEGDTLRISDTQATFLQAGDVLQVPNLFCDSDGANYTTTKYGSSYPPETIIVKSVALSGAAANVANVFVTRGNGYSTAAPAAGTVTTILSEYKLIRTGNALAEGGNAPNPVMLESLSRQNYCQFFSKTWGETSIEGDTDVYGKMTMADKAVEKRREFFREIEWALFDGRSGNHTQTGQSQRTTGGVVEFIPTAANALDGELRLVDFGGAFNLERQREIDEIMYCYGSEVKHWFCGGQYFTLLFNNLEKLITVNDQLSRRYGWKVFELALGHGVGLLHRHPKFTDQHTTGTGGVAYAKDIVIVDMNYMWLMVMKNHDVQIRSNIQSNRSHKREDEIFAVQGLYRQFPEAHGSIYNITA